jgi:hypothetical protein
MDRMNLPEVRTLAVQAFLDATDNLPDDVEAGFDAVFIAFALHDITLCRKHPAWEEFTAGAAPVYIPVEDTP